MDGERDDVADGNDADPLPPAHGRCRLLELPGELRNRIVSYTDE